MDGRVQKLSTSIDVEEISSCLNAYVKTLKRHIHVKRIQNNSFNNLKLNLKPNEDILIQENYSKNYFNKNQGQIQSAYFGQRSFFIFTACCYVNIDGSIINEKFTVMSEAKDHSRSAAVSCWMRGLSCIQEKYDLAESLRIHIWSDGCTGQFRSRFVFFLLSWFVLEHTIFWYYNERHYGTGSMDGVGGID